MGEYSWMIHPKSSKQRQTFIKNSLIFFKVQSLISNSFRLLLLFFCSFFSYPEYGKSESTLQREVTLQEEKLCLWQDTWKYRSRERDKWPQKVFGLKQTQHRRGNITVNSNYPCLDPINGCNYQQRKIFRLTFDFKKKIGWSLFF